MARWVVRPQDNYVFRVLNKTVVVIAFRITQVESKISKTPKPTFCSLDRAVWWQSLAYWTLRAACVANENYLCDELNKILLKFSYEFYLYYTYGYTENKKI